MSPYRLAKPRFLVYFAFEGGLIFAVLYGLAWATLAFADPVQDPHLFGIVVPMGLLFCLTLLATQWGNPSDHSSLKREVVIFGVLSLALGALCFTATWFVSQNPSHLGAYVALEGAIAIPLVVGAWRWLSVRMRVFNAMRERLLIVGTGEMARQVCRWIAEQHGREYGLVGFASEEPGREGTVLAMGVRIQTDYESLARFAPGRCERIIVALDEKRQHFPVRPLMELRLLGIEIEEATSFFERNGGKIAVETMLPSWLIFSEGFKNSPLRAFLKRTADLTLALTLLLVASPLMVASAAAIRLTSRGPVLYRQSRAGQGRRPFDLLKFRSMIANAEADGGPQWTRAYDPRITLVGRIIRPLRIDELPQLFNVLRGEMSFVGPRPERPHFVRQLEEKIPYYGLRMTVRPGITGWAQVEYGYGATDEGALEKLKYDLYYIKNGNLLVDLWIVLKTVKVVLLGSGAR